MGGDFKIVMELSFPDFRWDKCSQIQKHALLRAWSATHASEGEAAADIQSQVEAATAPGRDPTEPVKLMLGLEHKGVSRVFLGDRAFQARVEVRKSDATSAAAAQLHCGYARHPSRWWCEC